MLQTGENKIKKICETIKKETLEPAQKQAEQIISNAKLEAQKVLEEARAEAEQMLENSKEEIKRQQNVLETSMSQAAKQSLETLRQKVELELFNPAISQVLSKVMNQTSLLSDLVKAMVAAVEREGLSADFSLIVSKNLDVKAFTQTLKQQVLERLKNNQVELGGFSGGAKIKLLDKNITLDITDSALKELVSSYLRKDFRELILRSQTSCETVL